MSTNRWTLTPEVALEEFASLVEQQWKVAQATAPPERLFVAPARSLSTTNSAVVDDDNEESADERVDSRAPALGSKSIGQLSSHPRRSLSHVKPQNDITRADLLGLPKSKPLPTHSDRKQVALEIPSSVSVDPSESAEGGRRGSIIDRYAKIASWLQTPGYIPPAVRGSVTKLNGKGGILGDSKTRGQTGPIRLNQSQFEPGQPAQLRQFAGNDSEPIKQAGVDQGQTQLVEEKTQADSTTDGEAQKLRAELEQERLKLEEQARAIRAREEELERERQLRRQQEEELERLRREKEAELERMRAALEAEKLEAIERQRRELLAQQERKQREFEELQRQLELQRQRQSEQGQEHRNASHLTPSMPEPDLTPIATPSTWKTSSEVSRMTQASPVSSNSISSDGDGEDSLSTKQQVVASAIKHALEELPVSRRKSVPSPHATDQESLLRQQSGIERPPSDAVPCVPSSTGTNRTSALQELDKRVQSAKARPPLQAQSSIRDGAPLRAQQQSGSQNPSPTQRRRPSSSTANSTVAPAAALPRHVKPPLPSFHQRRPSATEQPMPERPSVETEDKGLSDPSPVLVSSSVSGSISSSEIAEQCSDSCPGARMTAESPKRAASALSTRKETQKNPSLNHPHNRGAGKKHKESNEVELAEQRAQRLLELQRKLEQRQKAELEARRLAEAKQREQEALAAQLEEKKNQERLERLRLLEEKRREREAAAKAAERREQERLALLQAQKEREKEERYKKLQERLQARRSSTSLAKQKAEDEPRTHQESSNPASTSLTNEDTISVSCTNQTLEETSVAQSGSQKSLDQPEGGDIDQRKSDVLSQSSDPDLTRAEQAVKPAKAVDHISQLPPLSSRHQVIQRVVPDEHSRWQTQNRVHEDDNSNKVDADGAIRPKSPRCASPSLSVSPSAFVEDERELEEGSATLDIRADPEASQVHKVDSFGHEKSASVLSEDQQRPQPLSGLSQAEQSTHAQEPGDASEQSKKKVQQEEQLTPCPSQTGAGEGQPQQRKRRVSASAQPQAKAAPPKKSIAKASDRAKLVSVPKPVHRSKYWEVEKSMSEAERQYWKKYDNETMQLKIELNKLLMKERIERKRAQAEEEARMAVSQKIKEEIRALEDEEKQLREFLAAEEELAVQNVEQLAASEADKELETLKTELQLLQESTKKISKDEIVNLALLLQEDMPHLTPDRAIELAEQALLQEAGFPPVLLAETGSEAKELQALDEELKILQEEERLAKAKLEHDLALKQQIETEMEELEKEEALLKEYLEHELTNSLEAMEGNVSGEDPEVHRM